MSYSNLLLLYQSITLSNPLIPVIALGIIKRENAGDIAGAERRRVEFEDNHGPAMAEALDTCILFLQMYGEDVLCS